MKRIICIFLSLFLVSQFFAQEAENSKDHGADSSAAFSIISELEPEESSNLSGNRSKVIFKTNVKNCAVYLNNNLQGRTQLSLSNLVDGYYLLRVEKDGYDTQENFIYVEHGKSKTFYTELQPNEETKKKEEARVNRSAQSSASASANASSDSATSSASESTASQNSDTSAIGDAK